MHSHTVSALVLGSAGYEIMGDCLFWGPHKSVPAWKAGGVATSRTFQLQAALSQVLCSCFKGFLCLLVLSFYFCLTSLCFCPILNLASWIFSNSFAALMTHISWFGLVWSCYQCILWDAEFPSLLTFLAGSLLYAALISSFSEQIVLTVKSWADFAILHIMLHKVLDLGNNFIYLMVVALNILQRTSQLPLFEFLVTLVSQNVEPGF